MSAPTKRDRLKLARQINHNMRCYVDALTPHITNYLASQGADPERVRLQHLLFARNNLEALIASQRRACIK